MAKALKNLIVIAIVALLATANVKAILGGRGKGKAKGTKQGQLMSCMGRLISAIKTSTQQKGKDIPIYDSQNPTQISKAYTTRFRSVMKAQPRKLVNSAPSNICSKIETFQNIENSLVQGERKQTIYATQCTDRAAAIYLGYKKTKGLKRLLWKGEMKALKNALENFLGQCTLTGAAKQNGGQEVNTEENDNDEPEDEVEEQEDEVEEPEPEDEEELIF